MADFHGDSTIEPLLIHLQVRGNRLLEAAHVSQVHLPSGVIMEVNRAFVISDSLRERVDSVVSELLEAMAETEGLNLHV